LPDFREADLIMRSQRGDVSAFDALVRTHYNLAYNAAYRLLGDADAASDATQAAFVRAYRSIRSFRLNAAFSTWLYRIVTNVCLDHLRQRERQAQSLTLLGADDDASQEEREIPDDSGDPALAAERAEVQELVQAALRRLTSEHRAVLVLYDLRGFSYEEVAEVLSLPLGTVKSRLNRARHALKEEIARRGEPFPR
jgi:RNA polymerase sigma-70 factor, ECF subfamily